MWCPSCRIIPHFPKSIWSGFPRFKRQFRIRLHVSCSAPDTAESPTASALSRTQMFNGMQEVDLHEKFIAHFHCIQLLFLPELRELDTVVLHGLFPTAPRNSPALAEGRISASGGNAFESVDRGGPPAAYGNRSAHFGNRIKSAIPFRRMVLYCIQAEEWSKCAGLSPEIPLQ